MTGRRSVSVRSRRNGGPASITALAGGSSLLRRRVRSTKRNKFHVAPKPERTSAGIQFASKGEMERHKLLLDQQLSGEICNLERQVRFVLVRSQSTGKPLLTWVADWSYVEKESGRCIIEDFTGAMTPLKKSNMRICADVYPNLVIRISGYIGSGKRKRLIITDCVNGRLPKIRV